MRFLDLPKLPLVASIIGMSVTLVAVPIALDGTEMGTRGAFAQSPTRSAGAGTPSAASSGRLQGSAAMTGVTNPVASGGFGRASGTLAATGNVTPAFGSTPTPALSSNPSPAFSNTPTSPVGGTVSSTSVRGTLSTRADGITSSENSASLNVSADGAGKVGATGNAPQVMGSVSANSLSKTAPNATVGRADTDDFGNVRGIEDVGVGSVFARNGNNRPEASDIDPDFVIVGNAAAAVDVPATPAAQFIMVCRNSDQIGCKAPPAFIIDEK